MTELDINSLGDARKYRATLAARNVERDPRLTTWQRIKRAVLLIMLAASFLIYHMISVNVEILSLPELTFSVKVPTQPKGSHRI